MPQPSRQTVRQTGTSSVMKKFSRPLHTVGHPPGTLNDRPDDNPSQNITLRFIEYDESSFNEQEFDEVEDCLEIVDRDRFTWIDIDGVHDIAVLKSLGKHFDLHPLLLEDIANPVQRSKVERYKGKTYIVIRLLEFDAQSEEVKSRQISLILTENTIITLHELTSEVFDDVRQRIRLGGPRIRTSGIPYLAYSLLDSVVDQHFILLENLGEHMENLEEALLVNPSQGILKSIHRLKRELIYLRKSVWPFREVVNTMLRDEDLPFHDEIHMYIRDLYDHTVQVMETIEAYRDINAGMLEAYLSIVSNRMNEVMKTLTIIATLFIPLTFVAGVYGMNFEHMPELHWRWAYPALWGFMGAIAVVMLIYFKRKRWL